jgi:hypothetical protein
MRDMSAYLISLRDLLWLCGEDHANVHQGQQQKHHTQESAAYAQRCRIGRSDNSPHDAIETEKNAHTGSYISKHVHGTLLRYETFLRFVCCQWSLARGARHNEERRTSQLERRSSHLSTYLLLLRAGSSPHKRGECLLSASVSGELGSDPLTPACCPAIAAALQHKKSTGSHPIDRCPHHVLFTQNVHRTPLTDQTSRCSS